MTLEPIPVHDLRYGPVPGLEYSWEFFRVKIAERDYGLLRLSRKDPPVLAVATEEELAAAIEFNKHRPEDDGCWP